MRLPVFLLAAALAAGCSIYRPDIIQGNYIDSDAVAQLKPGMTRDQVRYLMGPAMVADPLHPDRLDYIYYVDSRFERRNIYKRVTVFFDGGKLSRIEKVMPEKEAPTAVSEEQKQAAKVLSDEPDKPKGDND